MNRQIPLFQLLWEFVHVALTINHSREWVAQQTCEKQRLGDEEKHANHLYEVKACELDQRAVELAMAEEETRRALNAAHREYNKALVRLSQCSNIVDYFHYS